MKSLIELAWLERHDINLNYQGPYRQAVTETLYQLDQGIIRVAEKTTDGWIVNQWIKQAILLAFRLLPMQAPRFYNPAFDKIALKFGDWLPQQFTDAGIRAVPGAIVRHGAFIGKNTILMPSFINIGAYVGEGTMIDSCATVGSCAQIGNHCHISGGTGIGGVLEPLQAQPVIIEDNCFIGARSEIVEGVIVEQGAVIGMGVFITATTPIFDLQTGDITYGRIPAYSVVIAGTLPSKKASPNSIVPQLPCAVIIKKVDQQTRSKTNINELLRL